MIGKILRFFGLVRVEETNELIEKVVRQHQLITLYKMQVEDQNALIETHRELTDKHLKEIKSLKGLAKSKDEANTNLIRETQRQEHYIEVLEREVLSHISEEKILSEIRKLTNSIYVSSGTRVSCRGMGSHGYMDEYGNVSVESDITMTNPIEPIVISVSLDPAVFMRLYSESERQYYWQQTLLHFTNQIYGNLIKMIGKKH